QRALAALDRAVAAEQACGRADGSANQGAAAGAVGIVRGIGLAGVRGAACQQQAAGKRGGDGGVGGGSHGTSPQTSFGILAWGAGTAVRVVPGTQTLNRRPWPGGDEWGFRVQAIRRR